MQGACLQNPGAMLPHTPLGEPLSDDNFEPQPWYGPNQQGSNVQIKPGASTVSDLDFLGANAANGPACAQFVNSLR